ncbi:hypothetical protein B7Z00_00960 [Candidatus Saccharibacteria bacterium 32-50-10]|nr:MAG: hypothetical protein B7Z00_00960 [Candidatus Saccharibacteria bacterium 32-50-10]
MKIRRLSVQNVRSHEEKVIELSPQTTVIVGKNGVGKTTLLEAIYIALQGTSFKGSDSDILRHDAPWYRIDILLDDETTRSVTFDPSRTSGKKRFIINEKISYRMSPRDKYPVVLFEPEDLRLLHGSPSRRRQFIDHFISQIDPTYSTTLRRYDRALKQRNTLLKRDTVTNEDLFVWNVALSEHGARIIEQRIYAVEMINKQLNDHYRDIAQTNDVISAHYSDTYICNLSQKILRELEVKLLYDKAVKHTSVGPHRHDIIFRFNDSLALAVASRGEVRTILLALKRIETRLISDLTGQDPIILLDDVFSELDEARQGNLLQLSGQSIITSTNAQKTNSQTKLINI